MNSVVRKLTEMELRSVTGADVRLGTFWKTQPVVLVFIRHFG